jgi:hypothetical protein
MTYTLRDIPNDLWKQIQLNAEASGLSIRTYILLALERNNVQFKIRNEPFHADTAHKPTSDVQLENGGETKRFDKR